MIDLEKLLGKRIRIWDGQHASIFAEGDVVAVSEQPMVSVRTTCECGRPKIVTYVAYLPIDVSTWQPLNET